MNSRLALVFCTCSVFAAAVCFGAGKSHIPKGFQEISGDRFIVDLRYNTDDNFLRKNVYEKFGVDKCWLDPETANRLKVLEEKLRKKHLKLVLWDCFRPNAVQKEMWKLVPDDRYVANPKKGSMHNRGLAVDLTLANEKGVPFPMPTAFDDFSEKAAPDYDCSRVGRQLCRNRDVLISLMESVGMEVIKTEWWHYSPRGLDLKKYPIR